MVTLRLTSVLCDMDGTLGHTTRVCWAAFRAALEEHLGRQYSDAEITALFGPSEEGVFQRLVPDRWQACLQSFLVAYEREHDRCPAPFPGIESALRSLRSRGVRLGIVTGKGPGSAAISLRRLGLGGYFDAVETGSPKGAVKATLIRRLLGRWNLAPEEAAYIGDHPSDMWAAREAGVLPLAAAWATTAAPEALRACGPAWVFGTVEELSAWIEANLESIGTAV
ncbi:MAG: HAD family hydrolase [Anaerolineae bacterium]|nr:HAD family hydrolase [Anaerolineae bacterium]